MRYSQPPRAGSRHGDARRCGALVRVTQQIGLQRTAFHHWELVFPESLGPLRRGRGFDLIVGNPPWIRVEWADVPCFAELEPIVRRSRVSPKQLRFDAVEDALRVSDGSALFADELRKADGAVAYLNSPRLYRELLGA